MHEGIFFFNFTGVVADVSVRSQFADVKGLDYVQVPFSSIIDVVEDVIHGFCRNVLTHHPTLGGGGRDRQTELPTMH